MSKRKAFTLIELLVVISIIALLLSVLMPALSRVREQARQTICGSNQRQMGVAFRTYASDHREYPHRVFYPHWPHGGQVFYPDWPNTDTKIPAGFAALFEGRYLSFDESGFKFIYCPSNREFSYDRVFAAYQLPNGEHFDNPDWPNGLNYDKLFAAYCYWAGFPMGPNNVVMYPQLSKLMVVKETDSGNRVLVSDLTVTNPVQNNNYSESHTMDMGWTSHVRGGVISGGNTLYNDGSVRWMQMREKQENWRQHVWNWRTPSHSRDFWF